ncbi:MAG: transposase [Burkholderia sp.]
MTSIAVDETSYQRGHNYLTLVADALERKVVFVTEGKDAATIEAFVASLREHGGEPEQITSVSIDMSPAFIKGVETNLPNARITFDKFQVVAHAAKAVDPIRRIEQRIEQRINPELKGLRWSLLQDRDRLTAAQRADFDALIVNVTTKRTTRVWRYREQLREILDRKQINVVSEMLEQWCTNLMRSKVDPMKDVARMIRSHLRRHRRLDPDASDQRLPGSQTGLFQAAKRKARGYTNLTTMHTVVSDCRQARLLEDQPTCRLTHSNFKIAGFSVSRIVYI